MYYPMVLGEADLSMSDESEISMMSNGSDISKRDEGPARLSQWLRPTGRGFLCSGLRRRILLMGDSEYK